MFKHVFSLLCERVSIDQQSNLVSYLTSIEGVETVQLPFPLLTLTYASRWYKDNDSGESLKVNLFLIAPDGSETKLAEVEFSTISRNHRLNILLHGLMFSQGGTHQFRLLQEHEGHWIVVHELPFNVKLVSKESIEAKIKEQFTTK
jgi:hypothetical protein